MPEPVSPTVMEDLRNKESVMHERSTSSLLTPFEFKIGLRASSRYEIHLGAEPMRGGVGPPVEEVAAYTGRQLLNCDRRASEQIAEFLVALAADDTVVSADATVSHIEDFFGYLEVAAPPTVPNPFEAPPEYPRQFAGRLVRASDALGLELTATGFGRMGRGLEIAALETIGALIHYSIESATEDGRQNERAIDALSDVAPEIAQTFCDRRSAYTELEIMSVVATVAAAAHVAEDYLDGALTRANEPFAVYAAVRPAAEVAMQAHQTRKSLLAQWGEHP